MKLWNRSTIVSVLACLLLCGSAARAQAARSAGAASLTVGDVIKLAQAGLSEDIILEQIRRKGRPFDLSSDQIIELKTARVSDRVIETMLDPAKPDAAPKPQAVAGASVRMAPSPARIEEPEAAPPVRPAAEIALPSDVGVYARKQDQWVEVQPEIVYWKTAGALKTIATAGIRHGDVNGRVPGTASHATFSPPLRILIVAPEGVAMAEYRLLRLRHSKQDREFRMVSGGLLHSESGEFRDMLTFDGNKLASHIYELSFPASAGPGEYGLLPPGSTNGDGKIYSFRVVN